MKDERIEFKLATIKKAILIVWSVISIFSVIFKILSLKTIPGLPLALVEYTVFTASIIVLIIHALIYFTSDIIDERIQHTIQKIYTIAFRMIIILATISYLYQLVTLDAYFIGIAPINTFINSFFSITFIVYYIFARKQAIYFNYTLIENVKKSYYNRVFKNILMIVLFGALAYLTVYFIDLFNFYEVNALEITVSIAISIFIIVFEYLFLSIYERNHYQEALNHEKGATILLTKNYFLLLMIVTVFSVIQTLFNTYYTTIMISNPSGNFPERMILEVIANLLVLSQYELIPLNIIMIIIFYLSLKRSLPKQLKDLKLIVLIQFLFLVIGFLQNIFSHFVIPIIIHLSHLSSMTQFLSIHSFISRAIAFIALIIPLLLYSYFHKPHYRFSNLFLIYIGIQIINLIIPLFITTSSDYISFAISQSVIFLISSILTIFIYYQATRITVNTLPLTDESMV